MGMHNVNNGRNNAGYMYLSLFLTEHTYKTGDYDRMFGISFGELCL